MNTQTHAGMGIGVRGVKGGILDQVRRKVDTIQFNSLLSLEL